MKTHSKEKTNKFDKILKKSSMYTEIKKGMRKDEKGELKSYAIKRAVKLKRYVRN